MSIRKVQSVHSCPLENSEGDVEINKGNLIVANALFLSGIKSGANQSGAGAAAEELWKTSGHATLPDDVVMIGV